MTDRERFERLVNDYAEAVRRSTSDVLQRHARVMAAYAVLAQVADAARKHHASATPQEAMRTAAILGAALATLDAK